MFAQPFDLARLQLTGEKTTAFENIWADPNTDGLVAFAVSGNTFAFRTGKPSRQLGWFDRTGKSLGLFEPRQAADPELSQDDRLLAFEIAETSAGGPKTGLWTSELARGNATRLGPATRNDVMPTWSPDGKRIIFASDRAGSFDLYEKPVGQAPERELLRSSLWKYPESWSPDGRYLLFSQLDPKTRSDIWLLPLDGGKPAVFVGTDADEMLARFSPDGRWVAYTSNESGRPEVYVRAFPLSDARWQVSANGGANPLWRRDGRELFYISLDNRVVSAAVNAGGTTFDAGVPSMLFNAGPLARGAAVLAGDRLYAVTSRGDRFLVVQLASDVRASAITVVVGGR
jgi:Tol biopolymer transport system component